MKFFSIYLGDEQIDFRLNSEDSAAIEKKEGMNLQEYVFQISIKNAVNLLRYMRKSSVPTFNERDAYALYDKLVDNDYSLETIYMNIIFPACEMSGLLTESDLEQIRQAMEERKQAPLQN